MGVASAATPICFYGMKKAWFIEKICMKNVYKMSFMGEKVFLNGKVALCR
jgi:hypothetical protein